MTLTIKSALFGGAATAVTAMVGWVGDSIIIQDKKIVVLETHYADIKEDLTDIKNTLRYMAPPRK